MGRSPESAAFRRGRYAERTGIDAILHARGKKPLARHTLKEEWKFPEAGEKTSILNHSDPTRTIWGTAYTARAASVNK